MVTLSKVPVDLSGFLGGPGVINLYVLDEITGDFLDPVQYFFGILADQWPNDVTIQVPESGVTVDSETGELTGAWAGDSQAPVPGAGTGSWPSGVGAVMRWITTAVVNGRVLLGRSFLVPLSGTAYGLDGQLSSSARGAIQGAAETMLAGLDSRLVVWHRPTAGVGGQAVPVESVLIPTKPAILRSRRD